MRLGFCSQLSRLKCCDWICDLGAHLFSSRCTVSDSSADVGFKDIRNLSVFYWCALPLVGQNESIPQWFQAEVRSQLFNQWQFIYPVTSLFTSNRIDLAKKKEKKGRRNGEHDGLNVNYTTQQYFLFTSSCIRKKQQQWNQNFPKKQMTVQHMIHKFTITI